MKPTTSLLSQTVFVKGITILRACIKGLEADDKTAKVWYELLRCEVSDKTYTEAIKRICKDTANIYPGTNIVALILDMSHKVRDEYRPMQITLESGYTEEQYSEGKKRLSEIMGRFKEGL